MNLSPADKAKLAKLIDANQAVDNSEKIRKLKHSSLIDADVAGLIQLKRSHARLFESNRDMFESMARARCDFLANNYPGIFSRLLNDSMDIQLLKKLILVLQQIEDGKLSQHEASVAVGQILKEIYIDKEIDTSVPPSRVENQRPEPKNISWKQFSDMNLE